MNTREKEVLNMQLVLIPMLAESWKYSYSELSNFIRNIHTISPRSCDIIISYFMHCINIGAWNSLLYFNHFLNTIWYNIKSQLLIKAFFSFGRNTANSRKFAS